MIRVLIIMVLFFAATNAQAQDYYQCTKKGLHNGLTNMASKIAAYQKAGYRCRWYMGTGKSKTRQDRSPARTHKKRRSSTTRYTHTPRRSSGPAGQRQTYEPLIQHAATLYNVDPNLIRAVIKIESAYHPRAISSAGAKGLMQLMPTISGELQVTDLFDPRQNIMAGTRYLRMLINQFKGDQKLVLAAYHAGPGIVSKRMAIPYKATERYVRKVITEWLRYRAAGL